ncbi:MAG TPA: TetR/AcrR family transcriptional regulator [Actinomycetales bacterium]|nr:TetR/AcrR family transcriptional regulator [Actinomycetales bacterium]
MTSAPENGRSEDESLMAQAVRRRSGDRVAAAEAEVRRLLDVGLALMTEDPATAPKVADIVRRAGVTNDAFYRAFRGKADLMAAIADDGARRLIGYVRHQRDKVPDPREQLAGSVRAVMRQAADPVVADTTRAVLRNTSAQRTGEGGSPAVRDRFAELLAEPLRQLSSADPERDATVMARSAFAVMEQYLWAEVRPTEADIEHLVRFLLRGAGVQDA